MAWPPELTGLRNKRALVTGAARMSSIGRSTALALARAGCDIAVTGTGRPRPTFPADEQAVGWAGAESVADEVRALGRRAVALNTDAIDERSADDCVTQVVDTLGGLEIVVTSAAAARGSDRVPVVDLALMEWERVLSVNLTWTFLTARAFARHAVAQGGGGCLVAISSVAGKHAAPNAAAYSASKAGVQALTTALAQELGPAGIRANAICPGIIDTSRQRTPGQGNLGERAAHIPLRRAGKPEDVANLTLFLCSDQANWVTGQAWTLDGGEYTSMRPTW